MRNTAWAFFSLLGMHVGSVMRLEDPTGPHPERRAIKTWAALNRIQAAPLEQDSNVNKKPNKGNDPRLPCEPRNCHFYLTAPPHTPGSSVNETQSALPDHVPVLALSAGTRSGFCNYTAAWSHFPSTCTPKRIKGDSHFTSLICVRPED